MKLTIKEKMLLIGLLEKDLIRINEKEKQYNEMLQRQENSEVKYLIQDNLKSLHTRRKHCSNALYKIENEVSIND